MASLSESIPNLPNPPSVPARNFFKAQRLFLSDQLGFFPNFQKEMGDHYQVYLGTISNFVTHHPDAIEEVLVKNAAVIEKDAVTHDLEAILGLGLLTSEGPFWKRQRKLAAPSLKRKQIESYGETMVQLTNDCVDSWAGKDEVEIHHEMTQLTLHIVVKTLFGLEGTEAAEEVGDALETAMKIFHHLNHTLWRFVPKWVPSHHSLRFDRVVEKLDKIIYGVIERRKATNQPGDDLLWRLIVAEDEDGQRMTDKQLRDEALTMFLAGHETTALALSYAWHVLSERRDVLSRVKDEVSQVLDVEDGKITTPALADIKQLSYTEAFVKEILRLYPPAWLIGRQPLEPVEIAGFHVDTSSQILLPIHAVHRDERWYPEAEKFDPDRWLDERASNVPKYAYFPFGGGTRVCIGNHFAMMELILCVAAMVSRVEMTQNYREPLRMEPAVTLRPVTPMHMKLKHL